MCVCGSKFALKRKAVATESRHGAAKRQNRACMASKRAAETPDETIRRSLS